MSTSGDVHVGAVLGGRWEVLKHLADGSFGRVYAGTSGTEQVAIKILDINQLAVQDTVREFTDECRYLRHLAGCDRIIDILDSGTDPQMMTLVTAQGTEFPYPVDVHYMVLELAVCSLANLIAEPGTELTWLERLGVFRDVVKGVHQMHLKNTVNRDLKSDNVLVFVDKSTIRAKVADLGRSRITTEPPRYEPLTYVIGRGDLRFAAPELIWLQGEESELSWRAADLYLLGSVLFELATGVGITSIAMPRGSAVIDAMAQIPEIDRAEAYMDAFAALRDDFELSYEMFASTTPPSIRAEAVRLLRQLTSLSQRDRFPKVHGESNFTANLDWLIRRIDILRLTLQSAERQARRAKGANR